MLGFEPIDLVNQSLYKFLHIKDLVTIESAHKSLMEKGQVVTKYYRLVRKSGGFVWLQSYATLVNNPRNMPKPQHIVCICIVLGDDLMDKSCLLSEQINDDEDEEHHLSNSSSSSLSNSSSNSLLLVSDINHRHYNQSSDEHQSLRLKSSPRLITATTKSIDRGHNKMIHQHQTRRMAVKNQRARLQSYQAIDTAVSSYESCNLGNSMPCRCYSTICNMSTGSNLLPIGPLRRPSDDSCSIVSSVASTSVSSSSSINFHQGITTSIAEPLNCYLSTELVSYNSSLNNQEHQTQTSQVYSQQQQQQIFVDNHSPSNGVSQQKAFWSLDNHVQISPYGDRLDSCSASINPENNQDLIYQQIDSGSHITTPVSSEWFPQNQQNSYFYSNCQKEPPYYHSSSNLATNSYQHMTTMSSGYTTMSGI